MEAATTGSGPDVFVGLKILQQTRFNPLTIILV